MANAMLPRLHSYRCEASKHSFTKAVDVAHSKLVETFRAGIEANQVFSEASGVLTRLRSAASTKRHLAVAAAVQCIAMWVV
eukprot:918094-Amphidinium_carterae.1